MHEQIPPFDHPPLNLPYSQIPTGPKVMVWMANLPNKNPFRADGGAPWEDASYSPATKTMMIRIWDKDQTPIRPNDYCLVPCRGAKDDVENQLQGEFLQAVWTPSFAFFKVSHVIRQKPGSFEISEDDLPIKKKLGSLKSLRQPPEKRKSHSYMQIDLGVSPDPIDTSILTMALPPAISTINKTYPGLLSKIGLSVPFNGPEQELRDLLAGRGHDAPIFHFK